MGKVNWNNIIDSLQAFLVWFVIVITVICTMTLILFDIVVPAGGSMLYLTGGNELVATGISFATTGLLMALMFIGYSLYEKKEWRGAGAVVLVMALAVYITDIVFDSLSADVFRYGHILSTSEIVSPVSIHWMFRALIGGISTVGEALAIAIIVGMPVLKTFINSALPESRRFQNQASYQSLQSSQPAKYNATSVTPTSNIPSSIPRKTVHSQPTFIPRESEPTSYRPAPKPRNFEL